MDLYIILMIITLICSELSNKTILKTMIQSRELSILNKIKLMFTKKQEKKDDEIKEIINIEELPSRLEIKINELNALKRQLKNEISKKVSCFEIETNEKIVDLENIDISQRKEYDKIKIIVKDNLNIYISHLKRTIDNIKKAEHEVIENYIIRIFQTLNEFNKISSKPFEKATILIGEELGNTKAIVISFIQDINKIVGDNNFIFEKNKSYGIIGNLLSESKQLNSLYMEIDNKLLGSNINLENAKAEQNILNSKLSEIKETDSFKEYAQEKLNYKNRLYFLESEIQVINEKLKLKLLLKKFHHNKKIDELVRDYINNFKNALKEDKELNIINILDEDNKKLAFKLREIQNTLISLHPLSPTKIDKEISIFEEKINESGAYIINLENSIKNENKIKEKISIKLQKINSDLMEKSKLLF